MCLEAAEPATAKSDGVAVTYERLGAGGLSCAPAEQQGGEECRLRGGGKTGQAGQGGLQLGLAVAG